MKSFLTGTKTPISIFSVSVKPSESVGSAVVVPLGSKVVLPNVVETRYPQTVRTFNETKIKLNTVLFVDTWSKPMMSYYQKKLLFR